MRIFMFSAFLTSCCLWSVACQETPEFEGGSGGGGTNSDDWVNLGGGGGAGDADSDADGDSDSDADGDADTMDECTLTGDEGLNVGDLAPDLTLYQCDGTAVQTHQLFCDSPYTFLYSHAEW